MLKCSLYVVSVPCKYNSFARLGRSISVNPNSQALAVNVKLKPSFGIGIPKLDTISAFSGNSTDNNSRI